MKGVSPLIAAALIIAISLSAIAVIIQVGLPELERAQEISLFGEAKQNLNLIDTYVQDVVLEGEGSTRSATLTINGGRYIIDEESELIIFSMDSKHQIVGIGVSYIENEINVTGDLKKVYLTIGYDNINITDGGEFGKGVFNIIIKNQGYALDKQVIKIAPQ